MKKPLPSEEPILEARAQGAGCLASCYALLPVFVTLLFQFDSKSKPLTPLETVFIFLLGFGIAAYMLAIGKRDFIQADSQGLFISTVRRQVFVPHEEIEDLYLLESPKNKNVTRAYLIWRNQVLRLAPLGKSAIRAAILKRIEERAVNSLSKTFATRDREPTLLTLPATFSYQTPLIRKLVFAGVCLGAASLCWLVQWILVRQIGWQFFDAGGRFGFFLGPFYLLISLPFWLASALRNGWFLWCHRAQSLEVGLAGLTLRDGQSAQFLEWRDIEKLEIAPVPHRLTQQIFRVAGAGKTLEWSQLLPGRHAQLIEEHLAPHGLKWEHSAAASRQFDGIWHEDGRCYFSGSNVFNRLFTRLWLALSTLVPGTMIVGSLVSDPNNWREALSWVLFLPLNVAPLMALFTWVWSHHTLYICDETGLEYRGLFGHKTMRWDEAQSWNGLTLRAHDGRKIVVILAPEGKLRAPKQLAAEIEKRIARAV